MAYWLLKTEPDAFGIDDLDRLPKKITPWEGVRNYQARNFLRDEIHKNDLAFFYHSSCAAPGIVGIVKVITESYPDTTAFDPRSMYFDSKSNRENPRWFRVDVKLVEKFPQPITLRQLRDNKRLEKMVVLQKGNRLSVTPVSSEEWMEVLKMK